MFGRKRKFQRKWNSIYGRKGNENKNGHSFSAEKRKRKSPDNISVCSYIHSVTKSALQRSLVSLWTGLNKAWYFNSWTVCFRGLLLPSESISTICALCFTGVCFGFSKWVTNRITRHVQLVTSKNSRYHTQSLQPVLHDDSIFRSDQGMRVQSDTSWYYETVPAS